MLVLTWTLRVDHRPIMLLSSTKSVLLQAVQARSEIFFPSIACRSTIAHRYYVTAAPQCVYPDSALGGVLNSAHFDAIYGKYF